MTEALRAQLAGSPRSPNSASSRGIPTRIPYSAQAKLGTSGTAVAPCGGVSAVRGIGRSKRQCSTLTTMWTISGLPPGGARRGRLSKSSKGMRGLLIPPGARGFPPWSPGRRRCSARR